MTRRGGKARLRRDRAAQTSEPQTRHAADEWAGALLFRRDGIGLRSARTWEMMELWR